MPSMTSFSCPSSLGALDRRVPYSVNYQTAQGDRALVHKRYASCMDSTFPPARSKSDNMTGFSKDQSFAQWSNSSPPLTSNGDTFDLLPQGPSIFPGLSPYDDGPNGLEDPFDLTLFSWPHEGSYFCDGPRFPGMDTVTSSKPVLHPMSNPTTIADLYTFSSQSKFDDFSNVLNIDFATSLPIETSTPAANALLSPPTHSPSSSISAPSSCSSSPSHRSMDAFETKSRETSPTYSENDHHQRRRFPCLIPGCSRRFTSQYTLKVHVEAHKPKPRSSFPCTLGCSERFSRQHDRLRHEVAKHGKVCEFLCDDCGRFFSTKKTLGNHKCPVAQGGTRWVNS